MAALPEKIERISGAEFFKQQSTVITNLLQNHLGKRHNEEAAGESVSRPVAIDHDKMQQALSSDRNFSVSCELGVRYPVLKAVLNREDMHIRTAVSLCTTSRYNKYVYHYYESYMSVFACHILGIYTVYS
jgi:hypothetical protein